VKLLKFAETLLSVVSCGASFFLGVSFAESLCSFVITGGGTRVGRLENAPFEIWHGFAKVWGVLFGPSLAEPTTGGRFRTHLW
jgi:hypothetical protein